MILIQGKGGLLAVVDIIQNSFKIFEKQYSRNQDLTQIRTLSKQKMLSTICVYYL